MKGLPAPPDGECCWMDGCGLACIDFSLPDVCAHDRDCPKRAEALKDPPPGCCRREPDIAS